MTKHPFLSIIFCKDPFDPKNKLSVIVNRKWSGSPIHKAKITEKLVSVICKRDAIQTNWPSYFNWFLRKSEVILLAFSLHNECDEKCWLKKGKGNDKVVSIDKVIGQMVRTLNQKFHVLCCFIFMIEMEESLGAITVECATVKAQGKPSLHKV